MPDLGYHGLRLALLVAFAGFAAGIAGGVTRRDAWTRVAERAVYIAFGFASLAMLALFHALATNDFSLAYVASHSASTMPLGYRLAALWGGQAGSLLLWLWMLLAYGTVAVFLARGTHRALLPWICAVLLANACFFLVLIDFVTNPFDRVPPGQILSDGNGMNDAFSTGSHAQ